MDEPWICTWCGRGPFIRMQAHLNKCEAAKRKARETTEAFQEFGGQGWQPTIEPLWKRRRLDVTEVQYIFHPQSVH